jgi:hypothetical protein
VEIKNILSGNLILDLSNDIQNNLVISKQYTQIEIKNHIAYSRDEKILVLSLTLIISVNQDVNISSTIFIWNLNSKKMSKIEISDDISDIELFLKSTIIIVSVDLPRVSETLKFYSLSNGLLLSELKGAGYSFSPFKIIENQNEPLFLFSYTCYYWECNVPKLGKISDHYYVNQIFRWDLLKGSHPTFLDFDYDGMIDFWEEEYNLDKEDYWNRFQDSDNDGLMNIIEFQLQTNPLNNDTNGNGISDYEEYLKSPFVFIDPSLDFFLQNQSKIHDLTLQLNELLLEFSFISF